MSAETPLSVSPRNLSPLSGCASHAAYARARTESHDHVHPPAVRCSWVCRFVPTGLGRRESRCRRSREVRVEGDSRAALASMGGEPVTMNRSWNVAPSSMMVDSTVSAARGEVTGGDGSRHRPRGLDLRMYTSSNRLGGQDR